MQDDHLKERQQKLKTRLNPLNLEQVREAGLLGGVGTMDFIKLIRSLFDDVLDEDQTDQLEQLINEKFPLLPSVSSRNETEKDEWPIMNAT